VLAPRRALLAQAGAKGRQRTWIAEPELGDDAVRAATGRGWEEWCDLLDRWPGHREGHTAIATHVRDDLGIDGWWAQTVTVGYERITGLRLPYQKADGTFSAGRSRTVSVDGEALRAMLLSDADRRDLFPGHDTTLRSKPTAKSLRIGIGPGVALFSLDAKPDGRVTISVSHDKLPTPADVDEWKHYWGEWLDAVDGG
jgi:hypothetical protein